MIAYAPTVIMHLNYELPRRKAAGYQILIETPHKRRGIQPEEIKNWFHMHKTT